LGGLVLVGCSKEETPPPIPVPATTSAPATAPTTDTTAVPATVPATVPTTGPAAATDTPKPVVAEVEKKAGDILAKNIPTTNPTLTDANK